MNSHDYLSMIQETRNALKERQGWFGRVRSEDRFTASPSPNDELRSHLDSQRLLLKKGTVFWGALIQANRQLYELNDHWYPGEILCSNDPHFDANPDELSELCNAIFKLKSTEQLDPELQSIADKVTDELSRSTGAPLPQSLLDRHTTGKNVRWHSVIFDRDHLPERVLAEHLMPVLFHPRAKHVMILPATAWGPSMLALWKLDEDVKRGLWQKYEQRERERKQRPLIDVSPRALARLKQFGEESKRPLIVRVDYQGGHTMGMVDKDSIQPDDHQLNLDGVTFLMDPESAKTIWGCKLDWLDSGSAAGFMFE